MEETMSEKTPGFDTLAIHAGAQPDPATGARATPIYQTTSYVFEDTAHAADLFALRAFGNIYTRIMNPTQAVLESKVAALEGGTAAVATASGHSAQLLVFQALLNPGDEFIAIRQLYGGSINQFGHSFKSFGWNVVWADGDDVSTIADAVTDKTKAIFIESIANPGGRVTDIAAIAEIAKKAGVPLIVDNTLATPWLCKPLEHGASIVIHSLTKFMAGHGNSMGGVIVDGGTFDWGKDGKYPMLSEPNASYNGMVMWETFGNIAFAITCRVIGLRDLGPAISPTNVVKNQWIERLNSFLVDANTTPDWCGTELSNSKLFTATTYQGLFSFDKRLSGAKDDNIEAQYKSLKHWFLEQIPV